MIVLCQGKKVIWTNHMIKCFISIIKWTMNIYLITNNHDCCHLPCISFTVIDFPFILYFILHPLKNDISHCCNLFSFKYLIIYTFGQCHSLLHANALLLVLLLYQAVYWLLVNLEMKNFVLKLIFWVTKLLYSCSMVFGYLKNQTGIKMNDF